ncbi:hypothetical protein NG796_00400 [Laspinema sp. A4]|uniref:hypothetical protein n=1 Tax=Laspinema sp. D2d TaxID=2953686 RepID=UPI0021BB7BAA|nr:hypothetical protein [Laspinema sp. D2d]MCT7981744.1 hypothetical protein [Laspinema sp. D2d]
MMNKTGDKDSQGEFIKFNNQSIAIGENVGKVAGIDDDRPGDRETPKRNCDRLRSAKAFPPELPQTTQGFCPRDPSNCSDPHRQFQASSAVVYIEVPYSA